MNKELFIQLVALELVAARYSPRVSDCTKLATEVADNLEKQSVEIDQVALTSVCVSIQGDTIPNDNFNLTRFSVELINAVKDKKETLLEDMTVKELEAFAEENGIDLSGAKNKAEKLEAINAAV